MHSFVTYFLNTQLWSHPPWHWGYVMNKTSETVAPTEASVWVTQKQTDETRCLMRAVKEVNSEERECVGTACLDRW